MHYIWSHTGHSYCIVVTWTSAQRAGRVTAQVIVYRFFWSANLLRIVGECTKYVNCKPANCSLTVAKFAHFTVPDSMLQLNIVSVTED